MVYLRSFIFALGMWLYTPVFVIVALIICIPLSPRARYLVISRWALSMLWWLRLTCNVRYQVLGRENIPQQPVIVLAKHQSTWETLALQQVLPPQVWVLKRELLKIPFFGWGLAMTSPIAINRAGGRDALKQMLDQGLDRLKKGFFIVIFPEGTRTKFGESGKYHIGGAWLAAYTKHPILPIAHNAGAIWGRGSFLKRPGTITMSIGRLISSEGVKADALNTQVEAWIENEMKNLPPI